MKEQTEQLEQNDTPESIALEIEQLRKKMAGLVDNEEEKEVTKVKLPFASIHLRQTKGQTLWLHNVTPPQVEILVTQFLPTAGEMPVLELELNVSRKARMLLEAEDEKIDTRKRKKIEDANKIRCEVDADPRAFKQWLMGRYRPEVVNSVYPGNEPTLTTSFKRAMREGLNSVAPKTPFQQGKEGRLFDMQLVEAGSDS